MRPPAASALAVALVGALLRPLIGTTLGLALSGVDGSALIRPLGPLTTARMRLPLNGVGWPLLRPAVFLALLRTLIGPGSPRFVSRRPLISGSVGLLARGLVGLMAR